MCRKCKSKEVDPQWQIQKTTGQKNKDKVNKDNWGFFYSRRNDTYNHSNFFYVIDVESHPSYPPYQGQNLLMEYCRRTSSPPSFLPNLTERLKAVWYSTYGKTLFHKLQALASVWYIFFCPYVYVLELIRGEKEKGKYSTFWNKTALLLTLVFRFDKEISCALNHLPSWKHLHPRTSV